MEHSKHLGVVWIANSIEKVTEYIEKYEGDLITEFTKANLEIRTNTFTNNLINSVLEDGYDLCGKFDNMNLPQLQKTYESFKESFDNSVSITLFPSLNYLILEL